MNVVPVAHLGKGDTDFRKTGFPLVGVPRRRGKFLGPPKQDAERGCGPASASLDPLEQIDEDQIQLHRAYGPRSEEMRGGSSRHRVRHVIDPPKQEGMVQWPEVALTLG